MKHIIFLAAVLFSISGFAKQSDAKVSEIMRTQEDCQHGDVSTVELEVCSANAKTALVEVEGLVYAQERAKFKGTASEESFEHLYVVLKYGRNARVERERVSSEGGSGQGNRVNEVYIESTIFIIDQLQGLRLQDQH